MRCLITGNRGFLGRHFQQRLIDDGHQVLGCDIKDGFDCRELEDDHYDLVVHCAAIVGGRANLDGNPLSVCDNLGIDSFMMQWVVRNRPDHFAYVSSSAVYPKHLQSRANEIKNGSCPPLREGRLSFGAPDGIYGTCKEIGETMARLAKAEGCNVHIFRPFSGYGEDQDLVYPFPALIERVKQRQDPFEVWGTPDSVRDWIHVDDIVNGILQSISSTKKPLTLNVAIGIPIRFDELIEMMFEAAEWRPQEIVFRDDMPMGVYSRCADARRFYKYYRPAVPLQEGIRRALNA